MKKYFLKQEDGTITALFSGVHPSMLPAGSFVGEVLPDQEAPAEIAEFMSADENGVLSLDLENVREVKLAQIREQRDMMLKKTDDKWIEKKSKNEDASAIEADKTTLRNLPQNAEMALEALTTKETIEDYDAFDGLSLSQSYL